MEQKTNNKAVKIIIAIIVILLIIAIVGGIFVFKNVNNSTGTEWGDIYFDKLESNVEQKEMYENIDNNNMQTTFVKLKENTNPVMIVSYKKNGENNFNIYREAVNNDNEKYVIIEHIPYQEEKDNEYDIQFLYNIELQQYRWYKVCNAKEYTTYQDLQKDLDKIDKANNFNIITTTDEELEKNYSYYFRKNEMPQEIEDGEVQTISKFEETFIKVDDELVEKLYPSFTITTDMEETKIKNKMKENIAQYNPTNEEISNEIKIATENKITELETKKEQIKVAQEEKAKKAAEEKAKAEEEAKKKAEEEAKKAQEEANSSFKVGSYTMKYGTYKGTGGFENSNEGAILVLKANGTYTLTSNRGKTNSGTFKASSDGWINFDGGSWTYKAIDNNVLGDVGGYYERFKWSNN